MSIIKGKTNIVAGFGGTKRPLGEVYFSQSSLASDNPGALPGWTGEYYENGKTLFPDLYNFVKAHSELQVTKAEYDSAITSYGECPKYVVDENTAQTSLRLPKYANYIKMAGTEGITQKGAGLPDHDHITHGKGSTSGVYLSNIGSLCGRSGGETVSHADAPAATMRTGDASESNPIYGASDTVQPAHTTLYPWISAYTSAVPASTAQAAEFTGALSGKANTDLSNVLANIDYVVESQVNSDGSWYRKHKSGWLEQGARYETNVNIENITFFKPFASVPLVLTSVQSTSRTSCNDFGIDVYNLTTTGFTKQDLRAVGRGWGWEAKGMGAN